MTDTWAGLADAFVEGAYATVKGRVRTYVLHQHLLEHLPAAPARVLDVGGGAGHQSFPLARLGHDVTLLDPSEAMLAKARERLAREPEHVQGRVAVLHGPGERAAELTGEPFDVVLCHGVLMYVDDPAPLVAALCERVAPGGLLSVLALNAEALAVRPALEGRWDDALRAFDSTTETGVLGTPTRADTAEGLGTLMRAGGVTPVERYGGWLFTDWLDLPLTGTDVEAVAAVELAASRRDPYRLMSRVFHLVGRR